MFDMFGKLNEMKERMEEMKKRLDDVMVDADAGGGAVKVTASANRRIKSIEVDEELLKHGDKDQLEDLLTVAVNRALEKAKEIEETEMKTMAGGLLPPGLGM